MDYQPDNWVVIRIKEEEEVLYKVLGGWSGGYLSGDSWRMNSGIVRHEFGGKFWYFYGYSGSRYKCHVDGYGLRMNNVYVWESLKDRYGGAVEILEDQEWVKEGFEWAKESKGFLE